MDKEEAHILNTSNSGRIFEVVIWDFKLRGRRKLPYAFTEQGIYMLATVLRGGLAEQRSKKTE